MPCYDNFICAGGVLEEFSLDSKTYRRRGNILEGNIMAAMQDLVTRTLVPLGPIRSMPRRTRGC
jgi:hypothetical protein